MFICYHKGAIMEDWIVQILIVIGMLSIFAFMGYIEGKYG